MFSKLPVHGDAFFRALIDAAPDGIVIVNQEGRIVLVNLQTEKLFGYERTELLEKSIEVLVPERFRGKHRGHRAGFMTQQQLRPMGKDLELFGLRRDGSEQVANIQARLLRIPADSGRSFSARSYFAIASARRPWR